MAQHAQVHAARHARVVQRVAQQVAQQLWRVQVRPRGHLNELQ